MAVLVEMLAIEARGGRPLGADAFANAIGVYGAIPERHGFDLQRDYPECLLRGGNRRVPSLDLVLAEDAGVLQLLHPAAVAVEIDRRTAHQLVAGEDFHDRHATLNSLRASRMASLQSPCAIASPTKMIAGPSASSTCPQARSPSEPR